MPRTHHADPRPNELPGTCRSRDHAQGLFAAGQKVAHCEPRPENGRRVTAEATVASPEGERPDLNGAPLVSLQPVRIGHTDGPVGGTLRHGEWAGRASSDGAECPSDERAGHNGLGPARTLFAGGTGEARSLVAEAVGECAGHRRADSDGETAEGAQVIQSYHKRAVRRARLFS